MAKLPAGEDRPVVYSFASPRATLHSLARMLVCTVTPIALQLRQDRPGHCTPPPYVVSESFVVNASASFHAEG